MRAIIVIALVMLLPYPIYPDGFSCDTLLKNKQIIERCREIENGKVIEESRYTNGERDGFQKKWYSNGSLKEVMNYRNGCPVDTAFDYYESGKIKSIVPFQNCTEHGTAIYFLESGDTSKVRYARFGKSIGIHRSFHPNRRPASVLHYNDSGKKHGLCETWRGDGTRIDSIMYRNGAMLEIREYFTNGKVRQWIKLKNEIRDQGTFYDPKGKIVGRIRNGSGIFINSSEDGRNRRLVEYRDGEEVASRELKPGEKPKVTR